MERHEQDMFVTRDEGRAVDYVLWSHEPGQVAPAKVSGVWCGTDSIGHLISHAELVPPGECREATLVFRGAARMTDERFTELINGPLSHPLPMFVITRLVLALRAVVDATGAEGARAIEEHCREREALDRAGE